MRCWVNGQPSQQLALQDRGLAYGDGLFESIAVRRGRAPLLDWHLARLQRGCERLRLPCPTAERLAQLTAFIAEQQDGVVKLILTRGVGQRGYALPDPCQPTLILQGLPAPAYPAGHATDGVRLFACRTRLAEQPLLAGIKHLNRLEQVLARAEWQDPAFPEGLLCDTQGRVIEGVSSNLFMQRGGVLMTPDLQRCGVAGVMRAWLLEQAAVLRIPLQVRDISLADLQAADEVFVCNSLFGIWPVRELADSHWPVGELTRKLQALVSRLMDE